MAKLVLITGPQAVGKMTVGQELTKITNLKLFHNHMSIDLVSNFFSYGTEIGRNLVTKIRMEILEAVAKSDLEGRPIFVWTEEHIKAHFLICFIALTIIRIIQYKILKYENKSTLNVDGWEQGITAEKIKDSLNSLKACSDKKGTCMITKPKKEIEKILKSISLDIPDLTTIDKINQFKNLVNKTNFM